ncbi:MAG TPA: CsgG/HfaB family protein [Vicinamibacterales bacterium]|nr:CsgG/HfaB family protein [Vicinamibacterales bacterium]
MGPSRHSKSFAAVLIVGLVAFAVRPLGLAAGAPQNSAQTVTIGILPFLDASGAMNRDTAAAIGRLVQAEMSHSAPGLNGKVLTLDATVKLEDLDGEKAVDLGKAAKVDVVLLGTVLEASSSESSKGGWLPSIAGQSASVNVRSVKAKVTLQGDLYRVPAGGRIASLRVPGSHSDNKFGGGVYTNLGAWDGNSTVFLDSPLGKALQQAVADLVKKIAATKM